MRINDQINSNLSKEMMFTMGMLFGGTPIIIYGDELGIEQVSFFRFFLNFKIKYYLIENESFDVMDI